MSMMKSLVCGGIFLLALVSVIHTGCVHERLQQGTTQCVDYLDKTIHPIGSTWTNSMCQRCSCKDSVKSCCDGWPTSVSGGCTIKYDYETCTFDLIYLDKSKHCKGVGK